MGLINELEWIAPYDKFDNSDLRFNFDQAKLVGEHFGAPVSDLGLSTNYIPSLETEAEVINFDFSGVNPSNLDQDPNSRPIFYPVRRPNQDEIQPSPKKNTGYTHLIRGYGDLGVIFKQESEKFQQFRGETIFPFRLDLRARDQIFSSYPEVYGGELDPEEEPMAIFASWFPTGVNAEGKVYTPLALPELQVLQFKLSRIDPLRAFRRVSG